MINFKMAKDSNIYLLFVFLLLNILYVFCKSKSSEENRKGDTGKFYIKPGHNLNNMEKELKNNDSTKGEVMCKYYRNGDDMDFDKMSDVWQTVYYQLPEDIMCFKIHIKKTTEEERKDNEAKYGTFGNTVNWSKCLLEVRGAAVEDIGRKHFLMGDVNNTDGVLENVVIWEQEGKAFPNYQEVTYILATESPDQWRVIKDLLLLRDCNEGHVVVFSRFPRQHMRADIFDALTEFGESTMAGKMACSTQGLQ